MQKIFDKRTTKKSHTCESLQRSIHSLNGDYLEKLLLEVSVVHKKGGSPSKEQHVINQGFDEKFEDWQAYQRLPYFRCYSRLLVVSACIALLHSFTSR